MKGVFAAALEIQEFLRRAGAKFCFIGGVALQRWGQPRLTQDVDLTLLCGLGDESTLFRSAGEVRGPSSGRSGLRTASPRSPAPGQLRRCDRRLPGRDTV